MQSRRGETQRRNWYRSERYFRSGNTWYFATREKWDIGPFKTRKHAEEAAARYIKAIQEHRTSTVARKIALEQHYDSIQFE